MTQEQKRIKIAEACGWKFHPLTEHLYSEQEKAEAIMCWVRPGNDPWQMERVPDYFNDLNAMHKAEKHLTDEQQHDFTSLLVEIVLEKKHVPAWWDLGCDEATALVSATAAQRAEAFGKTLNLW